MAASDLINLSGLIDDAKCFALVRQHRWPEGVCCPVCGSSAVIRDGHDDTQPCRQRYRCKTCSGRFDDLTGTVLAGHHQPLRVWVLCLYFMFSLTTFWASTLAARGLVLPRRAAWYAKPAVTFSDALAAVRRQLWTAQAFSTSPNARDMATIPRALLDSLTEAACYPA